MRNLNKFALRQHVGLAVTNKYTDQFKTVFMSRASLNELLT